MKYDSIETGGDNYFSNAGAGLLLPDMMQGRFFSGCATPVEQKTIIINYQSSNRRNQRTSSSLFIIILLIFPMIAVAMKQRPWRELRACMDGGEKTKVTSPQDPKI